MFETSYPADWLRVDALIERLVAEAHAETRRRVDAALVEVDRNLGLSPAFINRARAQRARFARQRLLGENA